MSAHYSKFGLNTYYAAPYFQAHIPADYPLHLVLQKSRAFRRLPPRLRELSALAKEWERQFYPENPAGIGGIERWYDADGYELNPSTGERLTDDEIDAEWDSLDLKFGKFKVEDIPLPDGGFADPDTWEEPPPEPDLCDRSEITEYGVLNDIASRGRERTAEEYGVPTSWLSRVTSDADLARMVMGMHGKPWPVGGPADTKLYLKARGIKASGYDKVEGFVVLAGSEAVGDKKCLESIPPSALDVRNGLVKQGVLVPDAEHFTFTQESWVNSPSQATAVVMGCSASGLKEWKDDQGRPLKDIRVALPDEVKPAKTTGARRLLLPQARILQALLPVAGAKPSMSRAELAQRMNVSSTSGTISVAMGGRSDSPHKGLLNAGLVTEVKGEGNENVYQITTEGIKAIEDYLKEHGELPPPHDKTLNVNERYKK